VRFRPFGERFRMVSPFPPNVCKEKMKSRFIPCDDFARHFDERPRGIVVGNFVLIWLRAQDLIDGYARPKLIARVVPHDGGTRLDGFVLPTLSGLFMLPPLFPFMVYTLVLTVWNEPDATKSFLNIVVRLVMSGLGLGLIIGMFFGLSAETRYGRPMRSFVRRILDAEDIDLDGHRIDKRNKRFGHEP
jgi:hypothetical protein